MCMYLSLIIESHNITLMSRYLSLFNNKKKNKLFNDNEKIKTK